MPDLLDIAFPPDVQSVIADVKAAGARGVGLYVINLSDPATVQSPAFAQEVAQQVGVLPIIVPGNTPPAVSGVPESLRAWWTGGPVAIDIETGSSPGDTWVQALISALEDAGYEAWIYCNPWARSQYPQGRWWMASWDGVDSLPADAIAKQFTDTWTGASGSRYDASVLSDTVQLHGGAPMTWDGTYPMPDPPPASTEAAINLSVTVGNSGGTWWATPDGAPMGRIAVGTHLTAFKVAFDAVNGWLQMMNGDVEGAWWVKASDCDLSVSHLVTTWNSQNAPAPDPTTTTTTTPTTTTTTSSDPEPATPVYATESALEALSARVDTLTTQLSELTVTLGPFTLPVTSKS